MSAGDILILDDDRGRLARFAAALQSINADLRVICWRDAHSLIREVEPYLAMAKLISLDHDPYADSGVTEDPGDGLDAARFLTGCKPTCPVIVHSTNYDRSWTMINEMTPASYSG